MANRKRTKHKNDRRTAVAGQRCRSNTSHSASATSSSRSAPGLITGASDDDPSGIGTYSQAGAQFGYGIGWTMLLTFPLMAAIQEISARIGRVTGHGISPQCLPALSALAAHHAW